MTRTIGTLLAVLLVVIAGCVGGTVGGPDGDDSLKTQAPESTDDPTATDTPSSDDSPSSNSGSVDFYVSDEPNAIGDFEHLNVTITKIGFAHSGGNDSGWIERSVDNRTVDLTRLLGDNASLVGSYDVPTGKYTKVFAYVESVDATLENGESVNVKLPSDKLQLNRPFTVTSNGSVAFVFDIAVHEAGKSGKYILRPVISESGTDVPIEDVDEKKDNSDEKDETDEDEEKGDDENEPDGNESTLNATFVGNVTAGENATLQVTENGSAVENATVSIDGEVVGTTDADGKLTFVVPDGEDIEVKVKLGDSEVELEIAVGGSE